MFVGFRRKSLLSTLVVAIAATFLLSSCSSQPRPADATNASGGAASTAQPGLPVQLKVGIGTIIDHPALNAAIDGFKQALIDAGYKEGSTLHVDLRNAQGSPTNVAIIADGFAGSDANLFLAVGTDVSRALSDKERRRPILFAAVTDPVGAKIVSSLTVPGGNVTGTSDMNPVAEQLALIRELQPNAKRVGILYNPGESNSVTLVRKAKEAASGLGIELVEATAGNTAGVRAAAASLVGKVDAAYMPTDNTMAAAINVIIDVCRTARLPFYSSESESVKAGGSVAALAVDYRGLGRQTGEMAVQILKGTPAGSVPVSLPKAFELYLNEKTAAQLGLAVPASARSRAANVFN